MFLYLDLPNIHQHSDRRRTNTDIGELISKGALHLFYFIRTPIFPLSLDVLIFSAISASDVLIDVLNHLTISIRYLYSSASYLMLNTTVFSLSYNMKWSGNECNRILHWP